MLNFIHNACQITQITLNKKEIIFIRIVVLKQIFFNHQLLYNVQRMTADIKSLFKNRKLFLFIFFIVFRANEGQSYGAQLG